MDNPDQNHNGLQYDCFSGGQNITGTDGLIYNFGIKVNNSDNFYYPSSLALTPEMKASFVHNVTKESTALFMAGFILLTIYAIKLIIDCILCAMGTQKLLEQASKILSITCLLGYLAWFITLFYDTCLSGRLLYCY